MNDTGNFVLLSSSKSSLWESFRNPADTILPTQTLELNDMLVSRQTPTDFSQGRYYASMKFDGNFVLITKTMPSDSDFDDEYYNSQTSDQNSFRVVFDERASISVVTLNYKPLITLTPTLIPLPSDNYYRATLDFDGVFKQYYHPKNFGSNPQWTPTKSWPENICVSIDVDRGSGACGYNSICRLENQSQCLQGYSLVDQNNAYGNCKLNFNVQNCTQGEKSSAEDEYELLEDFDIDWPKNYYQEISPSTEEQCRSFCLDDCSCAAAVYFHTYSSCGKMKLPLSTGRVNTTLYSSAFIKGLKGPGNSKLKKILLLGGVSVTALSATFLMLFILFRKKYKLVPKWPIIQKAKTGREKDIELFFKNNTDLALKRYRYSELKNMTKSFSDKLGGGGYGSVYKGKLSDGRLVAVKVLNESMENGEEFMNELASISRTSHFNVVTLWGFCFEGSKRAVVYDFMPNGSLEKFILNSTSSSAVLGWKKLFEIAVGIAGELECLHQGCNTRILHFDKKPHNILLDKDFNPKISDFGLAKLCPNRSSIVSILVARGTIGYIAPEVFSRNYGGVSYKSNVYSYRMMILEMAGGKKNIDRRDVDRTSEIYFPHYFYKELEMDAERDGNLAGIMNEDEGQYAKQKLITVGLWCIQMDPEDRPSMTKVVEMLEGKLESLQVPPEPNLSTLPRSARSFSTSESM